MEMAQKTVQLPFYFVIISDNWQQSIFQCEAKVLENSTHLIFRSVEAANEGEKPSWWHGITRKDWATKLRALKADPGHTHMCL